MRYIWTSFGTIIFSGKFRFRLLISELDVCSSFSFVKNFFCYSKVLTSYSDVIN